MTSQLITKIKSKGYWKVIIRPNTYNAKLIPSLEECKELIKKSRLQLRGWDYPHIDVGGITYASDSSIHSYCDWPEGPMFEYWRFYQTGQFVHYYSMREDVRMKDSKKTELQSEYGVKVEKFLDIISTVYSVTEIYKFAANLYENLKLDGVQIVIELHGVDNRMLIFWDNFGRFLFQPYICEYPSGFMVVDKTTKRDLLIKNYSDIALDAAIEIFNKFNWVNIDKKIFYEDQKKLLERRF